MSSTDIDLIELADAVLDLRPGAALLHEPGGRGRELVPAVHRCGALVGLSCPPTVGAVAARHDVMLSIGGECLEAALGVAASRSGATAARVRCDHGSVRTLGGVEGPLVDICRLAIGRPTPPCTRTPLDLVDTAFADLVMREILDRDLGAPGPTWPELSRLHPLTDHDVVEPVELLRRRLEGPPMQWFAVRRRIITTGLTPDPELPPSLAEWLDDGALARWLFARYPEPVQLRADVCELLDPASAEAFLVAHGAALLDRPPDEPSDPPMAEW